LASLHGVTKTKVSMLSELGAALKGYSRYEWIYSAEARLNAKEKKRVVDSPSKAPQLKYSSNLKRYSSSVYQLMHAFRCKNTFVKLSDSIMNPSAQSGKECFFLDNKQPPPFEKPIDAHVGFWSSPDAVKNWLWLYLEALECRSRPEDLERAERFAFYLSHVVYQWQTSGSSDIDLLLFVIRSEHFTSVNATDRIRTSVAHHLKLLEDGSKKDKFSLRLVELFPQLMLADHPFIQRTNCCWSCDQVITPSIELIQPVFAEKNEEAYINSRLVSMITTRGADVKCKEIEFSKCLKERYTEVELFETSLLRQSPCKRRRLSFAPSLSIPVEFPFSTISTDAKDVLHQPIGQDIITELQSSWENYHQSNSGKFNVVLVHDAREKLESCKTLIQQRTDESWNQLVLSFTPEESDKVNRARRAAGLSSLIAPRTLFPLFGRPTEGLQLEMPLLENHLVRMTVH